MIPTGCRRGGSPPTTENTNGWWEDAYEMLFYLSSLKPGDPRNRTIPVLQIIPLPSTRRHALWPPSQSPRVSLPCELFSLTTSPPKISGWKKPASSPAGPISATHTHNGYPGVFEWENRCSVGPVDYYYIDFDLSMRFPKGKDSALWIGTHRTFNMIPELSETVPCNPFKVDVFQLGLTMANVIKEYPTLHVFSPVANRMISINPADRPEPAESLEEFNTTVARISAKKLRAPILRKYGTVTYLAKSVASVFQKDYPPTRRYESLDGMTDGEILLNHVSCGVFV
ncbi:hypothetical protein B0H14DRAFT_2574763 [Mycena olivaceomarginata]|nr:hypothetical protein B0H14DRAFT_2574763 [Mycena olivaceomarginata]